jgi:hypothetical protein
VLLNIAEEPIMKLYIAIDQHTNQPINHLGAIGNYTPAWDNPISALEWAQSKIPAVLQYNVVEFESDHIPVCVLVDNGLEN